MSIVDLWQASFNGAELTPLLDGREDISRYPTGCRRLRNAHGLIQGPARRRMGGRYVGASKSNGQAWLVPFIKSRNVAYMLEFGDNYIRFFRNRGQLLSSASPFDPYEVSTPWTYSDMTDTDGSFKFRMVQSNDILYICSPDTGEVLKQLNRFGDTNWTLTDFATVGGPFDAENISATTIYASAQTGTVTLTASTAIFTSDYVGSLLRLQPQDLSSVPPWEPSKEFSLNDLCRNDGKTYKSLTSASGHPTSAIFTGTRAPIHEEGSEVDGSGQIIDPTDSSSPAAVDVGITWEFQDPGYGVLKITAVGSGGTTATATVEQWRVGSNAQLPAAVVGSGNASDRWAWGVFSAANGYPIAATFFRERFALASAHGFAFSAVNGFTDFSQEVAGQVLADLGFTADLTSDRDETIRWMMPAHNALIIGTTGGEHVVNEMTPQQVFGPNNRKSEPVTGYGSNGTAPIRIGSRLLFVEANGLRVRATQLEGRFTAPSQNDLAEHITYGGIVQQAYQEKPDNFVWYVTNEGTLPCLTFSEEQDVFGWTLHTIGGFRDASKLRSANVISGAVIPSPDGVSDDFWYIAERRINGGTKRYIEYIPQSTAKLQKWTHEPDEAFKRRKLSWLSDLVYADSAATLDDPKSVTGVSVAVGGAVTITVASHGWSNGDMVRIDDIVGTWELNARGYEIENVTINTFDLVDIDGTDFTTYVMDGKAREMVTTITGLDPWEGETLQILTDGAVHPDRTVSSGSITLQYPAARVHTGYNESMILETMRPIGGNERGSSQGITGQINRVIMRVDDTIGGKIGPNDEALDTLNYRTALDAMDVAIPPFTGDVELNFPGENDTVRTIVFVQDQPLPATIIGFGTQQDVNSD